MRRTSLYRRQLTDPHTDPNDRDLGLAELEFIWDDLKHGLGRSSLDSCG